MAEILPIRRKTLSNQSNNQSIPWIPALQHLQYPSSNLEYKFDIYTACQNPTEKFTLRMEMIQYNREQKNQYRSKIYNINCMEKLYNIIEKDQILYSIIEKDQILQRLTCHAKHCDILSAY